MREVRLTVACCAVMFLTMDVVIATGGIGGGGIGGGGIGGGGIGGGGIGGGGIGGLSLTIDSFTTDELSFTIGGALAADTIGDVPGYLAIKNDWSNNQGVHTEIWSTAPTISANTITIGGVSPESFAVDYAYPEADSFLMYLSPVARLLPIAAGTPVIGSVTLTGSGIFDPSVATTLELLSGFDTGTDDWVRLETAVSPVPEPSTYALFALGALALGHTARRRSRKARAAP